MNKRSIRAFALGIAVSVTIIGSYYYTVMSKEQPKELTIEEAKSFLADKGLMVLTKDKYQEMEKATQELGKKSKAPQPAPVSPPKNENVIHAYKLEIVAGMVSHDIASILEKEKIIEEANEFETYLEENGYSKRIQLGSFELKAGMTYKQIAKIITKS